MSTTVSKHVENTLRLNGKDTRKGKIEVSVGSAEESKTAKMQEEYDGLVEKRKTNPNTFKDKDFDRLMELNQKIAVAGTQSQYGDKATIDVKREDGFTFKVNLEVKDKKLSQNIQVGEDVVATDVIYSNILAFAQTAEKTFYAGE